ncbi:MAG: DNA primase small subunit domain-containing protein [Candidatus Helarchaeota archaeon]
MFRHIKLDQIQDLIKHLKDYTFQHVYISGAYYRYPDGHTMNQKDWLGMDFLIDIDCDHFDTPCKLTHDKWTCKKCGNSGAGAPPEMCECGNKSFDEFTWICDECLEQAKKEVFKLLDLFLPTFGIDPNDLHIQFSGNRGYHVLVQTKELQNMDQLARRELVDFLTGTGLNLRYHGKVDQNVFIPSEAGERFGWGKYIYDGLIDFFRNCNDNILNEINLHKKTKDFIKNNRELLLNELTSSTHRIKSLKPNIWNKIVQYIKDTIKVNLDTPVSIDLHRLIRFANSIHGKTGFLVQKLNIDDLKDHDPFYDSIVFNDKIYVKVEISECPKFKIKDETYGPFKEKESIELPLPAAVFVLCKQVANYINSP